MIGWNSGRTLYSDEKRAQITNLHVKTSHIGRQKLSEAQLWVPELTARRKNAGYQRASC